MTAMQEAELKSLGKAPNGTRSNELLERHVSGRLVLHTKNNLSTQTYRTHVQ